jgi:CBS domain containing-hemolysin-like protein
MTSIEKVFMLDINEHLNFETLMRVFDAGHSRVPIYQVRRAVADAVTASSHH